MRITALSLKTKLVTRRSSVNTQLKQGHSNAVPKGPTVGRKNLHVETGAAGINCWNETCRQSRVRPYGTVSNFCGVFYQQSIPTGLDSSNFRNCREKNLKLQNGAINNCWNQTLFWHSNAVPKGPTVGRKNLWAQTGAVGTNCRNRTLSDMSNAVLKGPTVGRKKSTRWNGCRWHQLLEWNLSTKHSSSLWDGFQFLWCFLPTVNPYGIGFIKFQLSVENISLWLNGIDFVRYPNAVPKGPTVGRNRHKMKPVP